MFLRQLHGVAAAVCFCNSLNMYQNILAGRIEYPRHVSKTARDLISKLLQVRVRVCVCLCVFACMRAHPYTPSPHTFPLIHLTQADLSRRLGNLRGGSADIRKHPFFKVGGWGGGGLCVVMVMMTTMMMIMTRCLRASIGTTS